MVDADAFAEYAWHGQLAMFDGVGGKPILTKVDQ